VGRARGAPARGARAHALSQDPTRSLVRARLSLDRGAGGGQARPQLGVCAWQPGGGGEGCAPAYPLIVPAGAAHPSDLACAETLLFGGVESRVRRRGGVRGPSQQGRSAGPGRCRRRGRSCVCGRSGKGCGSIGLRWRVRLWATARRSVAPASQPPSSIPYPQPLSRKGLRRAARAPYAHLSKALECFRGGAELRTLAPAPGGPGGCAPATAPESPAAPGRGEGTADAPAPRAVGACAGGPSHEGATQAQAGAAASGPSAGPPREFCARAPAAAPAVALRRRLGAAPAGGARLDEEGQAETELQHGTAKAAPPRAPRTAAQPEAAQPASPGPVVRQELKVRIGPPCGRRRGRPAGAAAGGGGPGAKRQRCVT
jgi:hypothetical protein